MEFNKPLYIHQPQNETQIHSKKQGTQYTKIQQEVSGFITVKNHKYDQWPITYVTERNLTMNI